MIDISEAPDTKQVVLSLLSAITERRPERLVEVMAADVVDHNQVIHGEPDEPGSAFAAFDQQLAAFDPLIVSPEQLVAEGDTVVARLRVSGTHSGTHPRMPEPTGRDFDVEQLWIFEVHDGKVTEIRAVSDRLGLFLQLGWPWPTGD